MSQDADVRIVPLAGRVIPERDVVATLASESIDRGVDLFVALAQTQQSWSVYAIAHDLTVEVLHVVKLLVVVRWRHCWLWKGGGGLSEQFSAAGAGLD